MDIHSSKKNYIHPTLFHTFNKTDTIYINRLEDKICFASKLFNFCTMMMLCFCLNPNPLGKNVFTCLKVLRTDLEGGRKFGDPAECGGAEQIFLSVPVRVHLFWESLIYSVHLTLHSRTSRSFYSNLFGQNSSKDKGSVKTVSTVLWCQIFSLAETWVSSFLPPFTYIKHFYNSVLCCIHNKRV